MSAFLTSHCIQDSRPGVRGRGVSGDLQSAASGECVMLSATFSTRGVVQHSSDWLLLATFGFLPKTRAKDE